MTNAADEKQSTQGVSRRDFLRMSGAAVGGAIVGAAAMRAVSVAPEPMVVTQEEKAAPPAGAVTTTFTTTLPYPRTKIANAKELQVGNPVKATYPDAQSPIYVIKFGRPVMGGVGPDGDIVAFSRLCPHMGCTLKRFNAEAGTLLCGCHYSMFDLSKGGMMVIGQATDNLPQVELEYDEGSGDVYAVGVRGLIYGRPLNVLTTEQA